MSYVDGFVIAVQKKKLDSYRKMAAMGAKLWKKHGAVEYFECVGDDLNPKMPDMGPGMKMNTFPKLAKAKAGETVVFSFIVYKSRAHRDAVNKRVMKDPYMNPEKNKHMEMPFDMKRMAYGGFKTIVKA